MEGRLLAGPAGPLEAEVRVPPSKSLTNRALILGAAAGGAIVENPLDCEDTRLLARALERCGWPVAWNEAIEVGKRRMPARRVTVDLGNSGTGSRLLIALLAASGGRTIVDGTARLRERPMAPLVRALRELGAGIAAAPGGTLPVTVDGRRLAGGKLQLRPDASSQFVSALLLAAPLTEHGLELWLAGSLPSLPYLELTRGALERFGGLVRTGARMRNWRVAPGGLRPTRYRVEGDWSAAAFFLAAAAVAGGTVTIGELEGSSAQGDRAMVEALEAAGARVRSSGSSVVLEGPVQSPVDANLTATPDLFPALAVVAATAPPGSRLSGLGNLRHKESDRLTVMVANLCRLGADVETDGKALHVVRPLAPAGEQVSVTAAGDHRIAMAMAVAALRAGPLALDDASCVAKSFPGFWREWERIVP